MIDECSLTLTSLHWDDVLFPLVLSSLSLKDLFILRGISKDCKRLIDSYFSRMKYCDLSEYCDVFNSDAFGVLIKNCKHLKHFIAIGCTWLTNDLIKSLILNNKSIISIDLSRCSNLTSAALQPIIINLKNLTCLELKNCLWLTTGCLETLALHQSKLEVLSLEGCHNIGDVQVINLFLKRLNNLRELNLSGVQCVSNSTMEVIAHCNNKLKILNIINCHQVTHYGLMMVREYCRELTSIYVTECSALVRFHMHTHM